MAKIKCKANDRLVVVRTVERYIADKVTAPVTSAVNYLSKYGDMNLSKNELFAIARSAKYPIVKRFDSWYEDVNFNYDK